MKPLLECHATALVVALAQVRESSYSGIQKSVAKPGFVLIQNYV